MSRTLEFINSQYILVYKHSTNKDNPIYSEFHFDNIVNMKADLGIGLYTEGTGNLANVKAATNPVEFTFRQSIKSGSSVDFRDYKRDYRAIQTVTSTTGQGDSATTTTTKSYVDPITGFNSKERSIFKWAEMINKGEIDRATLIIYAWKTTQNRSSVTDTALPAQSEHSSTGLLEFIELTNAIPKAAIIKRNPYKGANVAELSFVADSMSVKSSFES